LEGPAPILSFLGIQIDTIQGTQALPQEKLDRIPYKGTHYLVEEEEVLQEAKVAVADRSAPARLPGGEVRPNVPPAND
jgi:hypothetical protein